MYKGDSFLNADIVHFERLAKFGTQRGIKVQKFYGETIPLIVFSLSDNNRFLLNMFRDSSQIHRTKQQYL